MSSPTQHDPGPVPEHEPAAPHVSLDHRLRMLLQRITNVAERAGWANIDTSTGRAELASTVVEIARIVGELVVITRQLAPPPAPARRVTDGQVQR